MGRSKRAGSDVASENNGTSEESQVISTLRKMFEDFKSSIHQEVNDLRKSVEFMSNKFDSFCEELKQTKAELKSTQDSVRSLSQENELLRKELNELQQYRRRDNVLVFGIPDTPEESVYCVIDKVSQIIGGVDLVSDISVAHRLPARPGKTKPIVIRFNKRTSRDSWLQRFKDEARKDADGPGLSTQRINPQLPPGRFTAGEHLTIATRNLLNSTRDAAKEKGYQFVWTRDCKVFVRKDERSNAVKINSIQDLSYL